MIAHFLDKEAKAENLLDLPKGPEGLGPKPRSSSKPVICAFLSADGGIHSYLVSYLFPCKHELTGAAGHLENVVKSS